MNIFQGTDEPDYLGPPYSLQSDEMFTPTTIFGYGGDDHIGGAYADDLIYGGSGNDWIQTILSDDDGQVSTLGWRSGNDIVWGGDGDDHVQSAFGNDTLIGEAGNDVLSSSKGDDWIEGGDGNDSISAGEGHDIIWGGGDNDWIDASAGDDIVFGGNGDDIVVGGTGNDILYGGGLSPSIFDGKNALSGGDGNDLIVGGGGSDSISGGDGDDVIYGDGFYDGPEPGNWIEAGAGNDIIIGGVARDYIFGQEGDDVIYGRGNHDSLFGGAGADNFMIGDPADGYDYIADFSARDYDALVLMSASFGGITNATIASHFYAGAGFAGFAVEGPYFAYDTRSGNLWYNTPGEPTLVVILAVPNLSWSSMYFV
jgi:Ca2+-binding RTX toxin-like protein